MVHENYSLHISRLSLKKTTKHHVSAQNKGQKVHGNFLGRGLKENRPPYLFVYHCKEAYHHKEASE